MIKMVQELLRKICHRATRIHVCHQPDEIVVKTDVVPAVSFKLMKPVVDGSRVKARDDNYVGDGNACGSLCLSLTGCDRDRPCQFIPGGIPPLSSPGSVTLGIQRSPRKSHPLGCNKGYVWCTILTACRAKLDGASAGWDSILNTYTTQDCNPGLRR